MENQWTELQIEQAVHRDARSLLKAVLETQPQLISAASPHAAGGRATGEFINALYDQLVVLARKNLEPETRSES